MPILPPSDLKPLPETMRAVRLYGPDLTPRVERVPLPRLQPDQVLLKVLAAGVCHTELQLLDGTLDMGVWPLTPGHEIAAEVVDGPADLLGERVLVYYGRPCGECDWCLQGQEQVCPNMGPQPGLSTDGGFAEYVAVPRECVVALPASLDPIEAAPLGCAAATAFHALEAVADVQPGEVVAVYGVGGVGLALVQLARLRGARVLAIGRSAQKLALAGAAGAKVVNATESDPGLQVARLTRGQGAHVVFELVGSDQTIETSLRMLRRQGRLVFVGYGRGRLRLNPLQLVLREAKLLSSLGNTRRELEQVVALAAEGRLRVPLAGTFALEDADLALDALREGRLEGRAALLPDARPVERLNAMDAITVQRPEPRREMPLVRLDAVVPRHVGDLQDELLAFVGRGIDAPRDDAEFNDLALRLFAYQFDRTLPYRLLCGRRGQTPENVHDWRHIPPVPIAGFKTAVLAAEGIQGAVEFNSSGTTRPEHKSRHFHPNLDLYNLNAALNFRAHVLPDVPEGERMRMAVLFPHRDELPHSSLAHWLTLMVERFGTSQSDWFVTNANGLDAERLTVSLSNVNEPVAVLAASFGLVHFIEHLLRERRRIELPPGSRVMDTGGYKGRSREYAKDELYALVEELLGVPVSHVVNMYGMTEHGTQFLDAVLRDRREPPLRYKTVPPWARTLVVDPETLHEKPPGQRGLLLHFDLINRASVLAVLTEDVGHTVGGGFEVLGRAEGSDARGCSIALDELIEAQRV